MEQARDRFNAGLADTVELVQAQESVATAEQDYISAMYSYQLARAALARARRGRKRAFADKEQQDCDMADNTESSEEVERRGTERRPNRPLGRYKPYPATKTRKFPLWLIFFLLVLAVVATGAVLWWIRPIPTRPPMTPR